MADALYGLVLAGGESVRLGEDKALARIHEGISQLDWSLRALSPFCRAVWVAARDARRARELALEEQGTVYDEPEVPGPMAGVMAGLRRAQGGGLFVLACDMPFVDPAQLLQLKSRREQSAHATCFRGSDGKPDPMCAIYEERSLRALQEWVSRRQYSLRDFLQGVKVETVTPADCEWLASVNTPEDLERARNFLS